MFQPRKPWLSRVGQYEKCFPAMFDPGAMP
jgi:hypothetical protein